MVLENENDSTLPLVRLTVKDHKFITLIDSGSTINIISRRAFNKIKHLKSVIVIKENTDSHCTAANNTKIYLDELVEIRFSLQDNFYISKFHVTDKVSPTFDLILGNSFLDKHSHVLGRKDGKRYFQLDNKNVQLMKTQEFKNLNTIYGLQPIMPIKFKFPQLNFTLLNIEKFQLKPQMYAFVDMYTKAHNQHICNAYIDAFQHESGFIVPPQLITLNGNHAKVFFVNNFDCKLTIPSRMTLQSNCWCARLAKLEPFRKYDFHEGASSVNRSLGIPPTRHNPFLLQEMDRLGVPGYLFDAIPTAEVSSGIGNVTNDTCCSNLVHEDAYKARKEIGNKGNNAQMNELTRDQEIALREQGMCGNLYRRDMRSSAGTGTLESLDKKDEISFICAAERESKKVYDKNDFKYKDRSSFKKTSSFKENFRNKSVLDAVELGNSRKQSNIDRDASRELFATGRRESNFTSSRERQAEKVVPCLQEDEEFTNQNGDDLARKANQTLNLLNEDLLQQEESSLWDVKAEPIPVAQQKSDEERKQIIIDHIKDQKLDCPTKRKLTFLCLNFNKLFYIEGDRIGLVRKLICKIETKSHQEPIYTKQFRLPIHDEKIIQEKVQELLRNDIIKRASSPYNSPIFLVRQHGKGRDDYRMVIDYRKINELVIQSRYKIPQIDDMLVKLRDNNYFSCLDIKNAFNSLGIDEESQPLLAFSTHNASYVFKTLIFGLSSGPSIYSNLLHEILHEYIDSGEIIIFIDDILIFTIDRETHFELLTKVFNRLAEFNVKLKLAKCTFMQNSVKFLGHEISKDGIKPLLDKVQAIKDLKSPTKRKELMSVLGLINYYLKFIPNLSKYSGKLTELLRKDIKYRWTEEHEEALSIIKLLISEHTNLCYPNPNKDYYLVTDASGFACGSYLGQKDEQGQIKPVGFYSRVFSETQSRYSATEREMLAIVIALEHFHPFLSASKIYVMTDHRPLLGVINASNSKRLEKMKVKILDLNLEFLYIPGKENVLADLLSRAVPTYNDAMKLEKEYSNRHFQAIKEFLPEKVFTIDCTDTPFHPIVQSSLGSVNAVTRAQAKQEHSPIKYDDNIQDVLNNQQTILDNCISLSDIRQAQACDAVCLDIAKFLSGQKVNDMPLNFYRKFTKLDEIICYISHFDDEVKYRYFLPTKELQLRALYNVHASHLNSHVGYMRCYKNLSQVVYWQNLDGDLHDYISKCEDCILYKKVRNIQKTQGSLQPSTAPNQVLFMDLVGPFTHSGVFTYILSVFDSFSQFLWLYPVRNATSDEVIKEIFGKHIYLYDIPLAFCVDNGSCFSAKDFTKLSEIYVIAVKFICPRSPWENSVEKTHCQIKNHLRTLLKGSETMKWHSFLPTICRIHNTNFVTPLKCTPSTIYFGRKPRNSIIADIAFPNDSFPALLATHLYNVQKLYKTAADNKGLYHEKLNAKKKQLKRKVKIGDKIYIKKPYIQGRSTALQNIMHGPFYVSKLIGNYILEYLDNRDTPRRCHVNNCKILHMDEEEQADNV